MIFHMIFTQMNRQFACFIFQVHDDVINLLCYILSSLDLLLSDTRADLQGVSNSGSFLQNLWDL